MPNKSEIKDTPFDKYVNQAIKKWPNVPKCYGWLQLSRRGEWLIKGEKIPHKRTIEFFKANYRVASDGCAYVQNGPQQVFVDLEYTPWIYRFDHHAGFSTHSDLIVHHILDAMSDEHGNLLIETSLGIGLIDDRDLSALSSFLTESGAELNTLKYLDSLIEITSISTDQIIAKYAFKQKPTSTDENAI
tara:strand:+ start:276 stop:839 length:564 start_codon:yes stop_codon:yes gene_type:complete